MLPGQVSEEVPPSQLDHQALRMCEARRVDFAAADLFKDLRQVVSRDQLTSSD